MDDFRSFLGSMALLGVLGLLAFVSLFAAVKLRSNESRRSPRRPRRPRKPLRLERASAAPMFRIEFGDQDPAPGTRSTIGGAPIMARDQQRPKCRECGAAMVLFVQMDVEARFETGVPAGSHLLVFMCPTHNEISNVCGDGPREPRFWEQDTGAFALILNPPGAEEHVLDADSYLVARALRFEPAEEEVTDNRDSPSGLAIAKVGGVPCRVNDDVVATCGCGAPMRHILQLPENYEFPQQDGAPEQPHSFSSTEYCLFLGNIVHVLACAKQCDPQAVTVILDN